MSAGMAVAARNNAARFAYASRLNRVEAATSPMLLAMPTQRATHTMGPTSP
jgi:hypothetical protein